MPQDGHVLSKTPAVYHGFREIFSDSLAMKEASETKQKTQNCPPSNTKLITTEKYLYVLWRQNGEVTSDQVIPPIAGKLTGWWYKQHAPRTKYPNQ